MSKFTYWSDDICRDGYTVFLFCLEHWYVKACWCPYISPAFLLNIMGAPTPRILWYASINQFHDVNDQPYPSHTLGLTFCQTEDLNGSLHFFSLDLFLITSDVIGLFESPINIWTCSLHSLVSVKHCKLLCKDGILHGQLTMSQFLCLVCKM